MAKKYTVNDGRLMLTLEPMREGGYLVRSPIDPAMITSADTIPEAFAMARDALKALNASRAKRVRQANGRRYRATG
jgi:hypothetical protein